MKLLACALPLLAGLPSVLTAQVKVGATLGPIAMIATLGGHGVSVRATPRFSRRTSTGPTRVGTPAATSASAARVLATARRYLGTHYRYGGKTPGTGFDRSGFVQ